MSGVFLGAVRDPGSVIETHLFAIAPNNSGSTFLYDLMEPRAGNARDPEPEDGRSGRAASSHPRPA